MITAPTAFTNYQGRLDSLSTVIVKMVVGGTTYLFANSAVTLSDGIAANLINAGGVSINQKIDPLNKTWSRVVSKITMNNVPYDYNASGVLQRPSDFLAGAKNDAVTIYIMNNPNAASLTDCLVVFVGLIDRVGDFSETEIAIRCRDSSDFLDTVLPAALMEDVFPLTPEQFKKHRIPLAYGEYTFDGTDFKNDEVGLAVSIPSSRGTQAVVADHPLTAMTDLWVKYLGVVELVSIPTKTINISSGGRSTVTAIARIQTAYLYPLDDEEATEYNDDPGDLFPDDPEFSDYATISDKDTSGTYVLLDDNLVTGVDPGTAPEGMALMGFGQWLNELPWAKFKFEYLVEDVLTTTSIDDELRMYYASFTDGDQYIMQPLTFAPSPGLWQSSASWADLPTALISRTASSAEFTGAGLDDATRVGTFTGLIDAIIYIEIDATGTPDTFKWRTSLDPDYTAGVNITGANQVLFEGVGVIFAATTGHTLADVWEITCKVAGRNQPLHMGIWAEGKATEVATISTDGMIQILQARLLVQFYSHYDNIISYFAECQGRPYGSWISDPSPRSDYDIGDMIVDPVGIVESLLRDELSQATADIDTVSFDAAEDSGVTLKVNLHNDNFGKTRDIIYDIMRQSRAMYFYSAEAKSKMIDMDDTTPVISRVFTYNEITPGSLKISASKDIIKTVNVDYDFATEFERFQQNSSTTSAGSPGTVIKDIEWPYVPDSASFANLAVHNYNLGDGNLGALFEYPHPIIEFQLPGLSNLDLEGGDWIQLDSVTFDPRIKCGSTSWADIDFLVSEYKKTDTGITVTGVAIHQTA